MSLKKYTIYIAIRAFERNVDTYVKKHSLKKNRLSTLLPHKYKHDDFYQGLYSLGVLEKKMYTS